MTTEDDFQAALDANPKQWQTRLVFADWLQERDDPRAEGYRALGAQRLYPCPTKMEAGPWEGQRVWLFGTVSSHNCTRAQRLPQDWFKKVKKNKGSDAWWRRFLSRRECEDAVARAFAELPADRRGELIAPKMATTKLKRKKSVKVKTTPMKARKPAAKK